jgi:hypothetical protein
MRRLNQDLVEKEAGNPSKRNLQILSILIGSLKGKGWHICRNRMRK